MAAGRLTSTAQPRLIRHCFVWQRPWSARTSGPPSEVSARRANDVPFWARWQTDDRDPAFIRTDGCEPLRSGLRGRSITPGRSSNSRARSLVPTNDARSRFRMVTRLASGNDCIVPNGGTSGTPPPSAGRPSVMGQVGRKILPDIVRAWRGPGRGVMRYASVAVWVMWSSCSGVVTRGTLRWPPACPLAVIQVAKVPLGTVRTSGAEMTMSSARLVR